ncbi:NB-ARC domain-containing protein [Lentzea sp. NPDC051838]|uniref:NB-ARC domain-containing protein n=1 Tax=Lentzea sp. NPDC051838 TaxID=3154849 RepID=UPI0034421DF6
MFTPGRPRTLDEYVAALRTLKVEAGNPSITDITRRIHMSWAKTGRPRSEWPARSTVGNCFQTGRRRPNIDLMLAVVDVLVDGDVARTGQWRQVLRRLLGETDGTSCTSVLDELPADVPTFVGRAELLRRFTAGGVVTLTGMPGIGKTALAVHLGHQWIRLGHVNGPVLFADLHGIDPICPPACTSAVLESFLRLLNVPGDLIPPDLDARSRLYRRKLEGTRALVVLDNAANAAQVTPLLPPDGHHALITSRSQLPKLPSASLPALTPAEALELLRVTAAPRLFDTSPAIQIATASGGHPLTLSIIGRHMREHPGWTLDDYVEPMTALSLEGGLRDALALSDRVLPPEPRRLLRLLTLHPDNAFDVRAAAALANLDVRAVQRLLDVLVAAHLLEREGRGHYRFHGLVRAYATERLGVDEPVSRSRRALERLRHHSNLSLAS